jgi:DNA-binding CsgD family transcriptional regulator
MTVETSTIATAELLERERELALIERMLARASGGNGGALLLQGPAGIGKTRLAQLGCEIAADGFIVLAARGGELESDLAYGMVRQLFEPMLDTLSAHARRELLGGPAALAARALDAVDDAGVDPAPVREALSRLAVSLSRRRPLLIVLDDIQWSDEASLLWLLHLVRRVDRQPIAVLATGRSGDPDRRSLIERIAGDPGVRCVEVPPLTQGAVARLAVLALGPAADRVSAEACLELTGGNPFLLAELLAAASGELDQALDGDLDVRSLAPTAVAQSVRRRLERLPAEAATLVRALAVLERAAKIDDPAGLAGIESPEHVATIVDALVAAGIFEDGLPLRFVHPLVRQAVYEGMAPGERAIEHERAAWLLAGRGEVEQAAAHLLLSGRSPDPWAVDVLRAAAAAAGSRGAPEVAVRHLRCALHGRDLGGRRGGLLGELGQAELRTLDPRGFDHLRQAIDAAPDALEAARLAVPTARALTALWRHREAVGLLEPVLAQLPPGEQRLRTALEGELIATASADTETLPLARERVIEALTREGSSATSDPVPWGIRAMSIGAAGSQREESVALARLAIDGGRLGDAFASGLPYPSMALVWAGEVEPAEAAWGAALDRATRTGSALEAALARGYLAICANARGEYARAEPLARAALEAVLEAGVPVGPFPLSPLADALVGRGSATTAVALLDRHLDPLTGTSVSFPMVLFSRGRARIAAGDVAGLDEVLDAGRRMVAQGAASPATAPWRSVAGLYLASRGEAGRARDLIGEELALARAFGARPALGVALTAAAELAEPSNALTLAREAVRTLEGSAALGALAEALACEGRSLASAGQSVEARVPLRRALDLAYHLGAVALADDVKRALIATGARPRRPALSGPEALTPREEAVARLAAEGRSSRDIADTLVISVRTVDLHLSRVYKKLGVDGRKQLRAALSS